MPLKYGLIQLLSYLKENKYRIAVATSPNKETSLKHFKRADITEYFDAIVCSNVIKSGKFNRINPSNYT